MKHFLSVQNGSVFALFLCIFTNFFLVLLKKRTFLRLLLCIFTNRQKTADNRPDARAACKQQHSDNLRTVYTDEHSRRQRAGIPSAGNLFLFLYRAPHIPATSLLPPGASRPTLQRRQHFSYRANLSLPTSSNLHFHQSHSFHHPTTQSLPAFIIPLSPATSHKKN